MAPGVSGFVLGRADYRHTGITIECGQDRMTGSGMGTDIRTSTGEGFAGGGAFCVGS